MSYTIFTSNPTALIAQPGRAVNTFPSGLVRVDQTYLGQTAYAESHRATLAVGSEMPDGDSSPCIDGLFIFPEVQERRREDGFTEFIVSAYGRINSLGQFSSLLKKVIFPETFLQLEPLAILPKVEFMYYSPLKKRVVPFQQLGELDAQAPTFEIIVAGSTAGFPVTNRIAELPANVAELAVTGARHFLSATSKKWAIRTFNPESLSVVYRTFSHFGKDLINLNSVNYGNFDEIVAEFDFVPFAALGGQSDIRMNDSAGNLLGMVSSLFP